MFLVSAKVGPFKSIDQPTEVEIEKSITALVGMNESGKTVFLQALEKSRDALGIAIFDPVDDYPRKDLPRYLKEHSASPAKATVLTYELDDDELKEANNALQTNLKSGFRFSVTHLYDNKSQIGIDVDERSSIKPLLTSKSFSSDALQAVKKATTLREIRDLLADVELTESDEENLQAEVDPIGWAR